MSPSEGVCYYVLGLDGFCDGNVFQLVELLTNMYGTLGPMHMYQGGGTCLLSQHSAGQCRQIRNPRSFLLHSELEASLGHLRPCFKAIKGDGSSEYPNNCLRSNESSNTES